MFKLNKFYDLEFLDHELDNNLTHKDAMKYKPIKVRLIGKVIKEFSDYIVVVTWDCPECVDVYRIIKSTIIKKKEVKI
jgi:hypothetical protein